MIKKKNWEVPTPGLLVRAAIRTKMKKRKKKNFPVLTDRGVVPGRQAGKKGHTGSCPNDLTLEKKIQKGKTRRRRIWFF